jgi:hypothetical protein
MADLNLDTNYFDHPKTIRLVGLLGRGAEVLPLRTWCYVAKHHPVDGRLAGYSVQEIEAIAGWWGERGKAVEALIAVRFLDKVKSGYRVHGWKKRAGHIWAYKLRSRKANAAKYKDIALLKPRPSRLLKGANKDSPSITSLTSPSLHDPLSTGGAGGASPPETPAQRNGVARRGKHRLSAQERREQQIDAALAEADQRREGPA